MTTKFNVLQALFIGLFLLPMGCNDDDLPPLENEEEVIDLVRLTFTATDGTVLTYEAKDPDGEGVANFEIPRIILNRGTIYILSISVENTMTSENITDEIREEGDEHLFFFEWNIPFASPTGNGNVDNRADLVNYDDEDDLGLPIGLVTLWETNATTLGVGYFRTLLKHQPNSKSANSTASDGETDIDLNWELELI